MVVTFGLSTCHNLKSYEKGVLIEELAGSDWPVRNCLDFIDMGRPISLWVAAVYELSPKLCKNRESWLSTKTAGKQGPRRLVSAFECDCGTEVLALTEFPTIKDCNSYCEPTRLSSLVLGNFTTATE